VVLVASLNFHRPLTSTTLKRPFHEDKTLLNFSEEPLIGQILSRKDLCIDVASARSHPRDRADLLVGRRQFGSAITAGAFDPVALGVAEYNNRGRDLKIIALWINCRLNL